MCTLPTVPSLLLTALRLLEYHYSLCSGMYAPCCLAFLLFFLVNVSRNGTELFVSGSTQASRHLPRSFRQASCSRNVHHFPCLIMFRGLSVLLLLCGDISLNPGPISFGVVNCRSVRNKGPSISDIMFTHSLSLLAMTETHICPTDNDSFLRSITPASFKLCHRVRSHGFGGGVGFFLNENIKFKILDSPTYTSFENIVIGSCSDDFFDQFLNLFEYLSSVSSSFFMCRDFNIHVDTTSGDRRKSFHWLPIMHHSVFKTAVLVYKLLHSGHPKYFEPFLKPRHSVYRTRRSQSEGVLLEVPHFALIYKSKKHFGLNFAYDAQMIWNDLPDDVCSAKSLSSFRKKLKTYLFEKAYPP